MTVENLIIHLVSVITQELGPKCLNLGYYSLSVDQSDRKAEKLINLWVNNYLSFHHQSKLFSHSLFGFFSQIFLRKYPFVLIPKKNEVPTLMYQILTSFQMSANISKLYYRPKCNNNVL